MVAQLSSKIDIQEEASQIRSIAGVSTSIGCALGITERGPHEQTIVTSEPEFQRVFGGYTLNGLLRFAVKGFFENGGGALIVKRVVHYSDIADASTKTSAAAAITVQSASAAAGPGTQLGTAISPYSLATGQTLIAAVDGGGDLTATFTGTQARQSAGGAGPFALSNNQTLTVKIDGGAVQTIAFLTSEFSSIGAATAAEVAAVINAKLAGGRADLVSGIPRISSDRGGTGSHVEVTGGTANGALGFPTSVVNGTGNVADIAAVTQAEVTSILGAALSPAVLAFESGHIRLSSNTTGGSSSIQVKSGSTSRTAFGLDTAVHSGTTGAPTSTLRVTGKTDGTYANKFSVVVAPATSGRATEFNLQVIDDLGVVRENWPNVSVLETATNFHEVVINNDLTGSICIRTTQLVDALMPAAGTFGPLTGGNDGLAGLVDADFVGSAASKTGMRGFDVPTDGRILFCPDRQTPVADVAMVDYATTTKKGALFPILCSPLGQGLAAARTYVESTTGLLNLSEFGAYYYPQIKVLNPNKALFGSADTLVVPPVGHIAGAYARTDVSKRGGIYEVAAGTERGRLVGAVGTENELMQEESNRDLVYPHRINPIRVLGGRVILDGSRTLKGDGNFPSISERRGVIFIEQSIKAGTEFARFRNNDETLRAEVDRAIEAFLIVQMNDGAFRSRNKDEAFVVDIGEGLNPPSVVFQGCLIGAIGLATQKPAEFIIFKFSQDTRALQAELGV